MADMSISNSLNVSLSGKTTSVEKKEVGANESTKKEVANFVADHKVELGSSLAITSVLAVAKARQTVPFVDNAVSGVASSLKKGSLIAGVAGGAGTIILTEDAVKNIKKGDLTKGLFELNVASVVAAGSVQLAARSLNITALKNTLSSPDAKALLTLGVAGSLILDGGHRAYSSATEAHSAGKFFAGFGEALGGVLLGCGVFAVMK